ncbi:restriction endonuclease subunit S, partial [Faecalibaculum rodentium]|uniref:restriction endonuclease subunit S n=1 Tax=Faecalibaculum rodentium TaxID=1702221 RepID=UPI0025B74462
PKIRFPGFTEPWEQRKLGELYKINNERNTKLIPASKTLSVATMTFNESGNGADDSSIPKYKVLRVGDVAFEGHTSKAFRYGRFVLNNREIGIMSPRFTTLRPKVEQDYNFWEYYIHSESVMKCILVKATKAGTMMNELVPGDLFSQYISVPEIDEQRKIGGLLKKIDYIITLHQRKLDDLKKLKQGLLQQMFV